MSRPNDSIQRKLHSALRINPLWSQFIEAVSSELDPQLSLIELTRYQKDVFGMLNYESITPDIQDIFTENLNLLASKYGYTPNTLIDSSYGFLAQELLALPLKIKRKGTYNGYILPINLASYSGEVYNFYYNSDKMIKNIKWDSIVAKYNELVADITNFNLPFNYITPDTNYSTLVPQIKYLDSDQTLDETISWSLDGKNTQLPTKHLGIDFYLKQITNTYLMEEKYFSYLEEAVSYNKSINVIPHTGASLNFTVPTDHSFDAFDTIELYTIPTLSLKTGYTWVESTVNFADVKYISIGNGTQYIPNHDTKSIFNNTNFIAYYSLQNADSTIYDLSSSAFNLSVVGTLTKSDGIFGQEVSFDGDTYAISSTTRNTTIAVNTSIIGWIKKDPLMVGAKGIFDCGKIKIALDVDTLKIYYARTFILSYALPNPTSDNLFIIELNTTANTATLFINGVQTGSTSGINSLSFSTATNTVIGTLLNDAGYAVTTDYFKGSISNIAILDRFFSFNEKNYIYNNKITALSNISQPLCRVAVADVEKLTDNNDWQGVNTYLPALTINEEILFSKATGTFSSTESVSGNTKYLGIVPYTFEISFDKIVNGNTQLEVVRDNGAGTLVSDYISGELNYNTGVYTVRFFTTSSLTMSYSLEEPSASEIYYILAEIGHENNDIVPGSVKIFYQIEGYYFTATDNGGVLVGSGLVNSTIDYDTGTVALNTVNSLLLEGSIIIVCDYYKYTTINQNTKFYAKYSIHQDATTPILVTELALEDVNKNALVYATFPAIEFHSLNNYLATNIVARL